MPGSALMTNSAIDVDEIEFVEYSNVLQSNDESTIGGRLRWRFDGKPIQNLGDFVGAYIPVALASVDKAWSGQYWQVGGAADDFPFDLMDSSAEVVFWGCGKRDDGPFTPDSLERCTFLGVRGPLSRDSIGLPLSMAVGDPALLLPLIHAADPGGSTVGKSICVPHVLDPSTDGELVASSGVDVVVREAVDCNFAALLDRIDAIAGASFVLAGSLSAAIIACAYDVPFAFYGDVDGDSAFPWRDFAASLGIEVAFVRTLDEGRDVYANSTSRRLRKPALTPILAAAPFAVATEFVLGAMERDLRNPDTLGLNLVPREADRSLLDEEIALRAANGFLRADGDALRHEIMQLKVRLARREAALSYKIVHLPRALGRAVRSPFFPLAFHKSGKPRGWIRKLLFHRNRTPRAWARDVVLRGDGSPRPAFHDFLREYNFPGRARAEISPAFARLIPRGDAAILVCSDMPPVFDQSSGALRLKTLIELAANKKRPILFCSLFEKAVLPNPLSSKRGLQRYESALHDAGVVQILYGPAQLESVLSGSELKLSDALLSFPGVAEVFLPIIRKHRPDTTILYDMVDFHALRMRREAKLKNDPSIEIAADEMQEREIRLAHEADVTIAVTEDEKRELLKLAPLANVETLPNIFVVPEAPPKGPERREGLLFVGGFWHQPNGDAVKWFVREVFPLIRAIRPDVHFSIVGSNADEEVQQLAKTPNVSMLGYVKDLAPLYESHRICVAPLRFGAGVKGKVGEAMANGLPVVGTSIAFEGMLTDVNDHFLKADDAEGFAAHVLTLMDDDLLWRAIQSSGRRLIVDRFSTRALAAKVESLFQ